MLLEGILFYNGISWFPTGIFQIITMDLTSIYVISAAILKFLILGMIYWSMVYLLVSVPFYLFTKRIVPFPFIT